MPIAAPVGSFAERSLLPGGLTLVTRLDRTAPRVAFSLLVRAGAVDETADTAGWRRLLTETMLRASLRRGADPTAASGAAGMSATRGAESAVSGAQMQRMADEIGGRIGATVGDDVIEFWAAGDSRHATALLDLLLTVVQRPRLAEADVRAARTRTLDRIEEERDDIAALATGALRSQLYRDARGQLLAYGLPGVGTPQSLEALNAQRLLDFHRRFFVPSRLTLAAAGDLDVTALRARAAKISGTTSAPAVAVPPSAFASPGKSEPALIVRQVPTRDAWVFVSFRVAPSNSADAPALRVLAAALGEEPNSRLQRRIKVQNNRLNFGGLAGSGGTTVGTSLTPRRFGSELVLFAQTDASSVDEAKNTLLDEVRKLREGSLSETELLRAKNFARGSWAVDRESLRDRAFQSALVAALNPVPVLAPGAATIAMSNDWDWPRRVGAVTTADVHRVAQKYLGDYAVALIMPED